MKIGQLAAATGTQAETIRYYEREGLLPQAARSEGNFRLYDNRHVEQLAFIRHCRCLDMTLDEIRVLLKYKDAPQERCDAVDHLLDAHIGHVADRIRELQALEQELRTLRAACTTDRVAADCGILDGLERAAREHDHAERSVSGTRHLGGAHGSRSPGRAVGRRAVKP
jgi:Cd(II)/Pb(II)-responsive transcriptional regulator